MPSPVAAESTHARSCDRAAALSESRWSGVRDTAVSGPNLTSYGVGAGATGTVANCAPAGAESARTSAAASDSGLTFMQ